MSYVASYLLSLGPRFDVIVPVADVRVPSTGSCFAENLPT
jgi:hypothetical protein